MAGGVKGIWLHSDVFRSVVGGGMGSLQGYRAVGYEQALFWGLTKSMCLDVDGPHGSSDSVFLSCR